MSTSNNDNLSQKDFIDIFKSFSKFDKITETSLMEIFANGYESFSKEQFNIMINNIQLTESDNHNDHIDLSTFIRIYEKVSQTISSKDIYRECFDYINDDVNALMEIIGGPNDLTKEESDEIKNELLK